jgi:hypothetical protein
MQKLVYLFALLAPTLLLLPAETAEAIKKITCRSIGLVWSQSLGKCVSGSGASTKKKPRYERQGNKYCRESRPGAQNMAGFRVSNNRAPYMQAPVYRYLKNLKVKCKGLVVESTFRTCDKNRNAGGKQRSRHLCGAAADTSGCPSSKSKQQAASICRQSGLVFIDEGPSKFPHCQMNIQCN